MKTYKVIVTRDTTESAVITVRAKDEVSTMASALDKADCEACDWELNDAGAYVTYLSAGSDDVTEMEDWADPCEYCGRVCNFGCDESQAEGFNW